MDWKRIAPWNWFKDEEESQPPSAVPVRTTPSRPDPYSMWSASFDRLFEEATRGLWPATGAGVARMGLPIRPQLDITEGRKAYTVRAELPGVERDDLSISVDGSRLTLRADKRQEREEDEEGVHWVERSYGSVQRTLTLPEDADPEAIEAKFKNGVLTLKIGKHTSPPASSRPIEVQAG